MAKFEIKMPKLGESITEGTIVSWSVKVGDTIQEDDVLFEVNTAKVSAEIPSPVSGKILEILCNEGDTVAVGTVVAVVELEAEGDEPASDDGAAQDIPAPEANANSQNATTNATPVQTGSEATQVNQQESSTPPQKNSQKGEEARWYSPVVLAKAKEAGISQEKLDEIPGTGYQGRLTKRNMEDFLEHRSTVPTTAAKPAVIGKAAVTTSAASNVASTSGVVERGEKSKVAATSANEAKVAAVPVTVSEGDQVIPMDYVRRIIADRMSASKKISPHVTTVIEVDVTRLVKWRNEHKDEFRKREGVSLTYMPCITEAVAHALKTFPRVNSSVDGYNIIEKKHINVGIAVSLDDGNLIVPVIKNTDQLNINGLAVSIATLADKARKNKLGADDIEGGTFTITNFGTFKSLFGTPIINQPEVAILGVGTIEKRPAVIETAEGDVIAIRHKMYLALSYDHRVIDGSLGGNFLKTVADYLENWNA